MGHEWSALTWDSGNNVFCLGYEAAGRVPQTLALLPLSHDGAQPGGCMEVCMVS